MDDRWNRIPDGIDPIVGYRAWYYEIGQREARLHPLTQGSGVGPRAGDWDGASWGWVTAMCSLDPASWHVAPVEVCTCGFYAMRELHPVVQDAARLHVWRHLGLGCTSGVVMGRVELAGKVIEHELGYRAERARIATLIPFRGTERSVMILAARLGVPISKPVDMPSGDLTLPPPKGSRFRDRMNQVGMTMGFFLFALIVVAAIQPPLLKIVVWLVFMFVGKRDRGSTGTGPTPPLNRARATPPPLLPRGSSPPSA
jgi:hypothetical protein